VKWRTILKTDGTIVFKTGNASSDDSGSVEIMTGGRHEPNVFTVQDAIERLSSDLERQQQATQRIMDILNPPPLKERIKNAAYNILRFLP
jgi:hypothetical protein